VNDLYFVSMTLTSVGYGDIVPKSGIGKISSIFLMLLGSIIFGACVTACSIVFHGLMDDELSNKSAEITRFMQRRSVPLKIQRRVRDNLRQVISQAKSSAVAPLHVIESLSSSMRAELCLSLVSDTYFQFPLFQNTQHSFVAELAQVQNWEQVLAEDLVADEGQAVRELIFVMAGGLQAIINASARGQLDMNIHELNDLDVEEHDRRTRIVEQSQTRTSSADTFLQDTMLNLPRGAWLGEGALLCSDRAYTSVITAVTKSELSILPAQEYVRIVHQFPRLLERHVRLKREVAAGLAGFKALRYQEELNHLNVAGESHWKGIKLLIHRASSPVSPSPAPNPPCLSPVVPVNVD